MAHATPGSASDNMEEVEQCGNKLAAHINSQFQLSSQVAAVDLSTLAAMNASSETFYAGLNERFGLLINAADNVQKHAINARKFADDMAALLDKAIRLEAVVNRLDEYTSRQEAALSRK